MENIRKPAEFLSYIKTPLSQTSLNVLYSANRVKYERAQLFDDFIQSLIMLVLDTYMGDGFTRPEQRVEHFDWCWGKNIENFNNEGIVFNNTTMLYEYFKLFMVDVFYTSTSKDKTDKVPKNILKLWKHIFNSTTNKTRNDVDIFIEVYKLFEKSLE